MLDVQLIVVLIIFLIVVISIFSFVQLRKRCRDVVWKARHRKQVMILYLLFAIILLIGIRHLNPLRWPDAAIRTVIINIVTPAGMTWDEVHQRIDSVPGWRLREARNDFIPGRSAERADLFHPSTAYFIPSPEGAIVYVPVTTIRATLGGYRLMFIARTNVYARWVFDDNGLLIDVSISRLLQI